MVEVIVEYEERIRAQERRPDGLLAKHAYSVLQVQSSVMDREAVFGLSYIGYYWVVLFVLGCIPGAMCFRTAVGGGDCSLLFTSLVCCIAPVETMPFAALCR